MQPIIDPIEYQEVVGDAFDEEVGAFEEVFGSLEDLTELEAFDEIEDMDIDPAAFNASVDLND